MPGVAERRLSVRMRTSLAATLVIGVALSLGSVLLVRLVEDALVANVAEAAARDAEATTSLLEATGATRLPEIAQARQQLYDTDDVLVATSEDAGRLTLPQVTRATRALIDGEEYVLVSRATTIAASEYDLRVALPLDDALRASATVSGILLAAVPVLLLVIAVFVWLVVGRALRPVETIRREVDAIGPAELDRRVAELGVDDEVGRLALTMNRMLARLDGAARAQRRFVSDASHELRSPLASIRQHAELARAHPNRLGDGELADVVLTEGARLQELVEQLLLLTRLDEGAVALVRRAVDLDDLLLDDARRLRDRGAVVVDTSGVGAARTLGDDRMLARLTRNLSDNAARHARSRVVLAARETADRVRLSVDDDGGGIPGEERDRVFERFVRLDDGRARDEGGSGLGLAIVAEIARAHGGTVHVETSPLGGARFVVDLPAGT